MEKTFADRRMSFFVARKILFDKESQRKKTEKEEVGYYKKERKVYMKESYTVTKSALVVKIEGELDQHNAIALRRELDDKISLGCDNLIFDLGALEFMDSSGIGVLIGRYKNLTALGGRAFIAATRPQVEKIIKLSAIDKIIPVYKSVDAALDAIEKIKRGEANG